MTKKLKHLNVDLTDDIYSFSHGGKSFKARKSTEHPNSVCFMSYNEKTFDAVSITDPDLLTAEMFLKNEGFDFCAIEFDGDQFVFPVFEALQNLPQIESDVQILFVADIYDGPIAGVIEHHEDFYWFEWCQDSIFQKDFEAGMGRIFSLRKLPPEQKEATRQWMKLYNELDAELSLVANPHIWPVSDWQKKKLRSLQDIESDMKKHDEKDLNARQHPITAWMSEMGQQFAAIQTFTLSNEDSKRFEQWQIDVANALGEEDQATLDQLFAKPPLTPNKWEIYRVDIIKDEKPFIVLRDFQGQPLAEDFWMTSRHRIQDLTYKRSSRH